jgi:hypothetical protein
MKVKRLLRLKNSKMNKVALELGAQLLIELV